MNAFKQKTRQWSVAPSALVQNHVFMNQQLERLWNQDDLRRKTDVANPVLCPCWDSGGYLISFSLESTTWESQIYKHLYVTWLICYSFYKTEKHAHIKPTITFALMLQNANIKNLQIRPVQTEDRRLNRKMTLKPNCK